MTNPNRGNMEFLIETIEKGLLPERLSHDQKTAFIEILNQDLSGKMPSKSEDRTGNGEANVDNKLISEEGVFHEADWAILVATAVEYETCIDFFADLGCSVISVELGVTKLTGRIVTYNFERAGKNTTKKLYLQRTTEQGANSSSNLVQKVCSLRPHPKACFLVGSCGAIPTKKLKLLDVILPTVALDGTKFSLDGGEIVPEPGSAFDRHAKITNLVAGFTNREFGLPEGCRVETAKQLITSMGKWDSLDNNVTSALLQNGENIIAVEMEGVGLVDGLKSTQETGIDIVLGISKGAADYCSIDELNAKQLTDLERTMPSLPEGSIKPTADPETKSLIQKEAIRRSLVVALKILERL
jgi:nucleoside phosphorylase